MLATMEFQLGIRSETMVYTASAHISQYNEGMCLLPQQSLEANSNACISRSPDHPNRSIHALGLDLS